MNNTKVAVVWTDKRNSEYYFNPNWAIKLTRYFPKNYEFAFFALTDTNSAIYREKENYTIWFKPDIKTLNYGINMYFEADILIIIGTSNFSFENIIGNQKKKILIHKGNIHKTKDRDLFDAVIVETLEDKEFYKNAIIQPVVDEENYNDLNVFKFFSVCYPQEISQDNFEFFNAVRLFGSISNTLSTTVQLPLYRNDILNLILNQSRVVGLFDEYDSFEIALASLSCNVPVVSLDTIKSAKIPAVIKAKNDVQDFVKQTLSAVDYCYNYREEYILPNFTVKHMANVIKSIL